MTSGAHVLSDVRFNRNDDAYLRGREYLTVVGMLSRCNVLLGSLVGATVGAMCLNGAKFDHVEIIDKGVYGGKA